MRRNQGFTLIELVIVMGIIAILTTLAFPTFEHVIAHQARSRALITLVDTQSSLEHYFSEHHSYQGATLNTLHISSETVDHRYQLKLDIINNDRYDLELDANSKQADYDRNCKKINITNLGLRSPDNCWH